jgi:hypothetical protein
MTKEVEFEWDDVNEESSKPPTRWKILFTTN